MLWKKLCFLGLFSLSFKYFSYCVQKSNLREEVVAGFSLKLETQITNLLLKPIDYIHEANLIQYVKSGPDFCRGMRDDVYRATESKKKF